MFAGALKSFAASPINSAYERLPTPTSTAGPWKIYDAKRKKTGAPYSIFVFDRKTLEHPSGSSSSLRAPSKDGLKAAQDEVVERLKREAGLLARLRHPCVLELVEPVEETRGGGLQFVSEPVAGSLGVLLAEKDEEEREAGGRGWVQEEGRRRRREVDIDELEIQKGLVQVGKALEFLHESANLIHGNLTPDAVMVNAKSDWKICGLGFAVNSVKPELPPQFDPRLPANVQLALDYAAPDLILDQTFAPSCDMFSLGVLLIALYNNPHRSPLETHNSAATYRRLLSSPSTTPNGNNNFLSAKPLPRPLTVNLLPQLITRRPSGRLTAREFQQNEYFDNILVSTLRFLDNFPAKTPSEKTAFMRGLPKILSQFPRSVLEKKILPGLVEELRDGSLLALILPNIFQIIENSSSRLFSEKVLRRMKDVFISDTPASTTAPQTAAAKMAERERIAGKEGGLTVVISKMNVIKEKTTAFEFKEDVLPLLHLALESQTHALQDLALRSLPIVLPKLDFPTLKNELFPVVSAVFTKTASLGIKIRALEAFRVLCGGESSDSGDGLDGYANQRAKTKGDEAPALDKYTVQEKVIPLLKGIKTKEPAVMMEALSVFREIGKTCDREVVAMDILPTLWAMSFGPLLGLEQFKSFMSTIQSLSHKIETEQTNKLSELSSNSGSQAQSAGEFLSFGGAPGQHAMSASQQSGDGTDFEALVFGKRDGLQAPITDGFGWNSASSTPRSASPAASGSMSRAKSPSSITPAPKFAWSTPSPTTTTPTGTFAPLQPQQGGFGSTSNLRTAQPPPQQQPQVSSGLDWSAASKKPAFASNPSPLSGFSSPSNGFANQPAAAAAQTHPTILYGQTRQQSAPTSNYSNDYSAFSIAPPPAQQQQQQRSASSGLQGMGFAPPLQPMGFAQAKKEETKSGLDKWESLL